LKQAPPRGCCLSDRVASMFMPRSPAVDPLAESIIYVCALIADQPRAIDRSIDYFGERRPVARKAPANTPSSPVGLRTRRE